MPFTEDRTNSYGSTIDQFSYNPDGMHDIGTVYHYNKSNIDGSKKSDVWIYIKSNNSTESFKIYPGAYKSGITDLVIADYDYKTFTISELSAYLIYNNGQRKINAKMTSGDGNKFNLKIGKQDQKGYEVSVKHVPTYNYNFDLCDFSFMYRHLRNKNGTLNFGVIAPNSFMKFVYAGKASLIYVADEEKNGVLCKKYEITGDAFGNKKGYIYYEKQNGYLVEINMPYPNNGNFNSFNMILKNKTELSLEDWNNLIINETNKLTNRK